MFTEEQSLVHMPFISQEKVQTPATFVGCFTLKFITGVQLHSEVPAILLKEQVHAAATSLKRAGCIALKFMTGTQLQVEVPAILSKEQVHAAAASLKFSAIFIPPFRYPNIIYTFPSRIDITVFIPQKNNPGENFGAYRI
jgi:hypothetical protein